MMNAYIIGRLPNTKHPRTGSTCLITIEISAENMSIFDRPVIDKNNASYTVNNFKIIEIIGEFKENYTCCYPIDFVNVIYDLNDIVFGDVICYLTKRRALISIHTIKFDNCKYKYNVDGQLLEKTVFSNECESDYQIEKYNTNGLLIEELKFSRRVQIFHKKWDFSGILTIHKIKEKNEWIDVLKQEINNINIKKYIETLNSINAELTTNAKKYSEKNEKIFIDTVESLVLYIKNSIDFLHRVKILKLLFDHFDSVCGMEILKINDGLKMIVSEYITEFEINDDINKIIIGKNIDEAIIAGNFLQSLKKVKSLIIDSVCQEYKDEYIESWSEQTTLNEEISHKITNKIKLLLAMIEICKGIDKLKVSTIIFKYLDTPYGKIFLTQREKFRNVVLAKINELKNCRVVAKFLTCDNKEEILTAEKLINILDKVNTQINNMEQL